MYGPSYDRLLYCDRARAGEKKFGFHLTLAAQRHAGTLEDAGGVRSSLRLKEP